MKREQERRKSTLATVCQHLNAPEPTSDYRHLLVNNKHKILFNFIPKVSCSTWKTIWRTLNSKNGKLEMVLPHYRKDDARLRNYRKVLFVREPMSRLLSAYLNKFHSRSRIQRIWESHYGRAIVKRYRGAKNQKPVGGWLDITFIEFIKYITDLGSGIRINGLNDHWLPQYKLSRPCHVKYDFIGHFENLAVEGPFVLRWLGVDNIVHFPEYHSSNAMGHFGEYNESIPPVLMRKLMNYYSEDYKLFGYSPDDVMSLVQEHNTNPMNLET
ncbi:carbohydrate sulfotransferase 14-like [Asterias amurensis]|uniref:carbohydrate sulfotransferase 14-like n=1 Tax=Asterias amurensis TaxID=7602 RepID=UPI003AB51E45